MENTSIYEAETSEIRILHTGDTHLGSRQYHSDVRRQDFFDSFALVIRDAIENQMDAVVHTGDLFDNRNPTIEDLIETIGILTRLKIAGIPFFGIVGNHESKQNTQWLDIFESMGLTKRLGSDPVIVEGKDVQIRFYGIDNLSAPRLAAFDFSAFEADPQCGGDGKKIYNVLTLHQLLEPVLTGQPLSVDDFTSSVPIKFDAVLLGDNHKYECVKHNGTWMTYPGSTERCSTAETDPRSYNILTFDGSDILITRRTIPTRGFVIIPIVSDENGEIRMDDIYSKIDAYAEKINGAVVFIELSGIRKTLVPISEIEEYVKNKGAIVARVGDKRDLEKEDSYEEKRIVFRDPDEVVTQELRRLNLTEAGFLLDSVIRDSETSKTNVAEASENRLKEYLSRRDFKEEFRRDSPYLENAGAETQTKNAEMTEHVPQEPENSAVPVSLAETDRTEPITCEIHLTEDVSDEIHLTEDVSEEIDLAGDISAEWDLTENISAERDLIEDVSAEAEILQPVLKKPLKKEKEASRPRQYTLGDMFGPEGDE
ncbi:MAG: exonuclease SbcCD subunit D [Methanosarcinales archaeon]|jgi:DNA repair exonuclease SbcCD nuclease subunit|nr:exonuclease SbcCD subunit D [Methanosarcinales archaeon]